MKAMRMMFFMVRHSNVSRRAATSAFHGALDGDVVQLGDVSNLQGRRSAPWPGSFRFGSVTGDLDVHELGDVTGDARAAPSLPHGALDGDVVQLGDVSNLQGRRSAPWPGSFRFGSVTGDLDVHELGDVTGDARAAPSLPHGALDGDVVQLGDVSNLQGRRSAPWPGSFRFGSVTGDDLP